jgi:lipopolysaccharide export system protein LptA
MDGLKSQPFFLHLMLLICLWLPVSAVSETSQEKPGNAEATPIVIKSKAMEMNNKLKSVTFAGDVNAKKDGFIIDCDRMVAYYETMPDQQKENEETTKIDKIVATGNVIVNRAEGGVATAEKATYFQKDERIILTGNPIAKRGGDVVKGERIIIFLKEDRISVEDSTVTITPSREKR